MSSSPVWWKPDVHADRRPFLQGRNRIRNAMRAWFAGQGFEEVDPSCLQVSPGNEAHLHAFATEALATDGSKVAQLYLHTSPEFAMKKLLAAGEQRIVAFAHVFRNRERGSLHHPEFTMVEWYRTGADYTVLMEDCAQLMALAAEAAGARHLCWKGAEVDPLVDPERLTVAEAFARHGIDLLATIEPSGVTDKAALAAAAKEAGLRVAPDDSWSDIFSRVLVERVEPELGRGRATILYEYPIAEAALARKSTNDPRVAERFELYACGVELANGFGELTEPLEQRRRFQAEMAEMQRVYGYAYPLDEEFLAALPLLPACAGIALGFDRLVMLATGAPTIEHTLWAPVAAFP
ncbi:MAG TPA: EF-P lysine aminoacylase EpmA [Geminicoccus sp.]|jgi:lysyl-tRNA synthetase class 2|uniref:EF-P lysine aminoacylase EpmA n=1 Tax=Geminicoccus sp. TaxID=2024832 RepID=UPI002E37BAF0|nr:EF-P lysine aminoacylase EpmA [Geminicoccus sp.]HEX2526540.1 EF-P lysine aminoacylase EpmA [Geminicoccus sp.]